MIKCFLLGAFSSRVLLYGISLLFGIAASTNLGEIAPKVEGVIEIPGAAALGFSCDRSPSSR